MPATPAWPPRSAPRLFVEQELGAGAQIVLDGPQAHYLARVMRVGAGDVVVLCDDLTGEWAAEVVEAGKRSVVLRVARQLRPREQVPDLWLVPALLKKDRFDWVLEKATELGVARIAPVITRRCVADKLNAERARAHRHRSRRTMRPHRAARTGRAGEARSPAARLARRTARCSSPMNWAANPPPHAFAATSAARRDPDRPRRRLRRLPNAQPIRAHPAAKPITLGPRILRGETAAIAALALWMGTAGDWRKQD